MKVIFELETEVARCDYELEMAHGYRCGEPEYATLFAHTEASLVNNKLLKVEQHCYLRHGEELPEQPWIKPRVILEPALESEDEMALLARQLHAGFIECSRRQLPAQFIA